MRTAKQLIQVGDRQVVLPEGVTVSEWGLEKVTTQNPRIRAFLGCINLLGGVLESNYAILHCSPERLEEVWRKVRKVSDLIRHRIGPLLSTPSCIPALETARLRAEMAYEMLADSVLGKLEDFPVNVAPHRLLELRKLLCISIGQLHSFLQDTFSELAANDPRSGEHDVDYFLSRRFSQDIDEAEWLYSTVVRLNKNLQGLAKVLEVDLGARAVELRKTRTIPHHHTWEEIKSFLDLLTGTLAPRLREVLALRGIRFSEMEILDRYATDIPVRCRILIEVHELGNQAVEEMQANVGMSHQELEQCGLDLKTCHAVISRRMASQLAALDDILRDLLAFIPLWLEGISKRRALMLKGAFDPTKGFDEDEAPEDPEAS